MVGGVPSPLGYSWALGPGLGDLVISSGTGLGFGSSRALLMTIGLQGVDCWADMMNEISQSLSRNQLERKRWRVGDTGAGLTAIAGVTVGSIGVIKSATLDPELVVREQEGMEQTVSSSS